MELDAWNASGVTIELSGNKYIPKFQPHQFQAPYSVHLYQSNLDFPHFHFHETFIQRQKERSN
jgi:hypothetical protein